MCDARLAGRQSLLALHASRVRLRFHLLIAVFFVLAAAGMTVHEFRKKKRIHLDEANKHQIP